MNSDSDFESREELGNALGRSRLLIGYLILALGLMMGFFHLERLAARIEVEGLVRANQNCEAVNEVRSEINAFLNSSRGPDWPPFPEDMDQATREWLEEVQASQPGVSPGRSFDLRECPPLP